MATLTVVPTERNPELDPSIKADCIMQKTILTASGGGLTNGANGAASPNGAGVMELTLTISDAGLRGTLAEYPAGDERREFAVSALKIGAIALQQAQGRIDAERVRQEGERIIANVENALTRHQVSVADKINDSLALYFDPNSGQFSQRVKALVDNDGELERVIRARVDGDGSELAKTLDARIGANSPLMNALDPKASDGVILSIAKTTEETLAAQREIILREFSLDNGEGALRRLVGELKESHGDLKDAIDNRIETVANEFSLNKEDSALSRLWNRVSEAQTRISREFSLDEEGSALARMRKQLLDEIERQRQANEKFQADFLTRQGDMLTQQGEMLAKIAEMTATREESERSTRRGVAFEDDVFEFVKRRGEGAGDVVERTGATTGLLRGRRVGDAVITLPPEHAAAGAKIVIEAKDDASYSPGKALSELDEARRNRGAGVGLFVLSANSAASAGFQSFARRGDDVLIVWDAQDPASDVVFDAGVSVAKAISVQSKAAEGESETDFEAVDKAIAEIIRETAKLDEISKSAETIESHAGRIMNHARIVRNGLNRQISALNEQIEALR